MAEQPTSSFNEENAYRTVTVFWESHGAAIHSESGPGTFKHNFVQKMGALYSDIASGREEAIIHMKILDILGEQRMCMIQFESCLDEFNRYLATLRLLDTIIKHRICDLSSKKRYPERRIEG